MFPTAVSFDLDATLLDNSFIPSTIAACCRFATERTGVEQEQIAAANAAAFRAHWPEVEEGWALGTPTGEGVIREVWRRALELCGCADSGILDDLVGEHLRLDWANARLFDDVLPLIEHLRCSGVRLALITNGASDTQRRRLASLEMGDWFDVVVISSEIGAVKPDPSVFAVAAQSLGVDGRLLWHVGDNLQTDVLGAVMAGHTAVWVNREHATRAVTDPAPHFEVSSLAELMDVFARQSHDGHD